MSSRPTRAQHTGSLQSFQTLIRNMEAQMGAQWSAEAKHLMQEIQAEPKEALLEIAQDLFVHQTSEYVNECYKQIKEAEQTISAVFSVGESPIRKIRESGSGAHTALRQAIFFRSAGGDERKAKIPQKTLEDFKQGFREIHSRFLDSEFSNVVSVSAPRPEPEEVSEFLQRNPLVLYYWHPSLNSITPYELDASFQGYIWFMCDKNPQHVWETYIANREILSHLKCLDCLKSDHLEGKLSAGKPQRARTEKNSSARTRPPVRPSRKRTEVQYAPDTSSESEEDEPVDQPRKQRPARKPKRLSNSSVTRDDKTKKTKKRRPRKKNESDDELSIGKQMHRFSDASGSFAVRFPLKAAEWNYERNRNLDPYKILCGSSIEVWFRCWKNGHEWKCKVSDRVKNGRQGNCPFCSGQ